MIQTEPSGLGNETHSVFTYGSLMYRDIFEQVTSSSPSSMPARANHWQRYALAHRTYPGALPQPHQSCHIDGVLWTGVTLEALYALDRFEGDEYRRIDIIVETANGQSHRAFIYQWLCPDLVQGVWDPQSFEQKHRRQFVQIHGNKQD